MLSTESYSGEYGTRHRLRNDDIIGARMFPTGTAGTGLLRIDPFTGIPDAYRCSQCGFVCKVSDGITAPGFANDGDGFIVNDATSGDPNGGRPGCPFCGSANSRQGGMVMSFR